MPEMVRAKSILLSGQAPLSWKPQPGLVKLSEEREKLFDKLKKLAGNTRVVKLDLPNQNTLFVKMECENRPTGSHYDRVYPRLLECIERIGITPEKFDLVENSSGNATAAFGHFARKLGYKTIAFLPSELTAARRQLTIDNCDEVVVADEKKHGWGVFGAAIAMRKALSKNREDAKENPGIKRMYCVNHSQVLESLDAVEGIVLEVKNQLKGKKPDYFIGVAGNGTILYGVGRALKNFFPEIKIIGIETFERPVLHLLKFPGEYEKESGAPAKVEDMGGKDFFAPGTGALGVDFPHLHSAVGIVGDVVLVKRADAEDAIKELSEKNYKVGPTSAISYFAAKELAKKVAGKNILVIFYDLADRY